MQILFALNSNLHIGLQQLITPPVRNPRNPNQIEIAEKVEILPSEYSQFNTPQDAYEAIVHFLSEEFQIAFDEDVYFKKDELEQKTKNKSLYFYIFEHNETAEQPKLRGVLYVTTSSLKPSVWVAFNKNLELEYDTKIYK
jgi:hypothetical protein